MARVLFVLGGALDVGGAENQLILVSRALLARGFEVSILCLWRRGSQADALEREGVTVHALARGLGHMRGPLAKLSRLVGGLLTTWRRVRRDRPDIVHFVLPHAYLVGGIGALAAGAHRCVMGRRGMNRYLRGRPLTRWIEQLLHRRMAALLANSCRVAQELIDEGAPQSKVGLIYNGIADERFTDLPSRAQARATLGLPDAGLVLVKVANLWSYKGHADLLDALAAASFGEQWRLLLVGREQGAGAALRKRVSNLGLSGNVLFLGESERVPLILAASDIAVCASHEEGFSNAVLEYLAAGLPSVVTDVGGNREAVGNAGLVVPAGDVDAMRQALESLTGEAQRKALGGLALQRASTFSMQRCIDAHETLYRNLLDTGDLPVSLRAVRLCTTDTDRISEVLD
ncbi:MAG: glycosyltransferase [Gammaproteobacteria bacterium]|nr:glycosyltransferase [Gammaproteobacteria bacterium]